MHLSDEPSSSAAIIIGNKDVSAISGKTLGQIDYVKRTTFRRQKVTQIGNNTYARISNNTYREYWLVK